MDIKLEFKNNNGILEMSEMVRQLASSLKSTNGIYLKYMDSTTVMSGIMKQLANSLKSTNGIYLKYMDSTTVMSGIMKQLANSLKSTNGIYPKYMDSTTVMSGVMKQLVDTLKRMDGVYPCYINSMTLTLKQIASQLKNIDYDSINVNSDGTINYKDDVIDINETLQVVNEIFDDEKIPLKTKIDKFKEKHLARFWIIILLLNALFIQPLYSISADFIKTKVYSIATQCQKRININDQNQVNSNIKKEVVSEINKSIEDESIKRVIFQEYRFVNTKILNVRVNCTMKSRIMYQLKNGQVVKILKKNKNWTFIEYISDDCNISIKGWVNTRYIRKFN